MSFNEFLQERFEGVEGTEELRDITRHGLSRGVSGFIYYNELKKLFIEHEEEILDYLMEDCGMTLSDIAIDAASLGQLATNAVWMYVECWAVTEYEQRMTTLEEMNNENIEHFVQRFTTEDPMEQAYAH